MCQALSDAAEAPPPGFCRHVDFEVEGGAPLPSDLASSIWEPRWKRSFDIGLSASLTSQEGSGPKGHRLPCKVGLPLTWHFRLASGVEVAWNLHSAEHLVWA